MVSFYYYYLIFYCLVDLGHSDNEKEVRRKRLHLCSHCNSGLLTIHSVPGNSHVLLFPLYCCKSTKVFASIENALDRGIIISVGAAFDHKNCADVHHLLLPKLFNCFGMSLLKLSITFSE
jgi:hypothetical protein